MYCTQCGEQLTEKMRFCFKCGTGVLKATEVLSNSENLNQLNPGYTDLVNEPDSEVLLKPKHANTKEELYAAVIGPDNLGWYTKIFNKFDNEGRVTTTWNWPACLFTMYWMLYRKMWFQAGVYFLCVALYAIITPFLSVVEPGEIHWFHALSMLLAFFVVPLYANAIYYNHCREKITEARYKNPNSDKQIVELTKMGGTSKSPYILLGVIVALIFFGILMGTTMK